MTLRDGLAAMRSSRKEEREEEVSVPEAPAARKVTEKREPFATRLKPSLRHGLKRRVLDLSEQGERVTVEDVIEALLLRYIEDEAFQREIEEQLG